MATLQKHKFTTSTKGRPILDGLPFVNHIKKQGGTYMYDFAIVGGGIVGLSTGMALYQRFPNAKVVVIEKEACCCRSSNGA